jgi:hypothetical protein
MDVHIHQAWEHVAASQVDNLISLLYPLGGIDLGRWAQGSDLGSVDHDGRSVHRGPSGAIHQPAVQQYFAHLASQLMSPLKSPA